VQVKAKGEKRIEEMKLKVAINVRICERKGAEAYWFEGSEGVAMAESRDWKLELGRLIRGHFQNNFSGSKRSHI